MVIQDFGWLVAEVDTADDVDRLGFLMRMADTVCRTVRQWDILHQYVAQRAGELGAAL